MSDSFFFALQFLTRIKICSPEFEPVKFGRSSAFFPIVGLIVGVILLAGAQISQIHFSQLVTAALLVVLGVIITGGLHLDGFMDSIDGLFSGRTVERQLEIMKDSRVGAFGVIGLACLFLLRFAFFTELLNTGKLGWLIAAPVFARWCIVYAIRCFTYLRREGLGNPFAENTGRREFGIATVTMIVLAVGALGKTALFLIAAGMVMHYFLARVNRHLGGLTGDIYGATAEISECLALMFILLGYTL